MKVLIPLLAILGATYGQIEPFGTEICRLFANGVKLRKPGTCQAYITCQNGISKVTECESSKIYDKEGLKCDKKTSDSYCSDPCSSKSPFWEPDPKSCNGYYKCISGTGTQGYCPSELYFDKKQQACVYESESSCEGYAYCDVTPNGVPFKNEKDCQKYYTCVKGKLNEFYCENGYYHPQNGCVKRSEVECLVHPAPINICGTNKVPIREKFVSDRRTCRGYYYCKDKGDSVADVSPTWGQCPETRFFDPTVQVCYPPAAVVCDEDRCDGRRRTKVISGTKGCQHYLICDGDLTVSEEKCPDGKYFDDDMMECTTKVMNYAACS